MQLFELIFSMIGASGTAICAGAFVVSLFNAVSFMRQRRDMARRIGCKFLSESLLYLVIAVGTMGQLLHFDHEAWFAYRIFLILAVLVSMVTTARLTKAGV